MKLKLFKILVALAAAIIATNATAQETIVNDTSTKGTQGSGTTNGSFTQTTQTGGTGSSSATAKSTADVEVKVANDLNDYDWAKAKQQCAPTQKEKDDACKEQAAITGRLQKNIGWAVHNCPRIDYGRVRGMISATEKRLGTRISNENRWLHDFKAETRNRFEKIEEAQKTLRNALSDEHGDIIKSKDLNDALGKDRTKINELSASLIWTNYGLWIVAAALAILFILVIELRRR